MLINTVMSARDPAEPHRAATMLELLYDLVSVIAIAAAASLLHHEVADGHTAEGITLFLVTFWTIFWAWMNFTWFASAYDTDDAPYRLAIFVQIIGALIMAAGIHQVSVDLDFSTIFVGFVVMRFSLVFLWLRAASTDPVGRPAALRYAAGIVLCQFGWAVLNFLVPHTLFLYGFIVLVICEHAVPVFAEQAASTTWHRHHIIERYGLLTIIVLGESMLASYNGIRALIGHYDTLLVSSVTGGLLILLAMWWLYFDEEEHDRLNSAAGAFLWGYVHALVFASATAVGAGLAVVTDQILGHADIGATIARSSVAIPVAFYLIALWFIHQLPSPRNWWQLLQFPLAAAMVLATPFFLHGVLFTGVLLSMLLVVKLWSKRARA